MRSDEWRARAVSSSTLRQGYLGAAGADGHHGRSSVRVRIVDRQATLNIKSRDIGHTRLEFEYSIPLVDAEEILARCTNRRVEKIRCRVPVGDVIFEVDEFLGANRGLVVAELELAAAGDPFPRPPWLGREVTDELRYYNDALAQCPWSRWNEPDRSEQNV